MKTAVIDQPKTAVTRQRIPKVLIYEMRHGKPIYYRDYRKVAVHEKSLEEIMGSSIFQAQLIALIVIFLGKTLDLRQYVITTNELGFFYSKKSWRALDIAVFRRADIKAELHSATYVKIPPQIVIEVDTKAEVKEQGDLFGYLTEKTEDLLAAGVEKVIWILTETRKVVVAESNAPWLLAKWSDSVLVLDDLTMRIDQFLENVD